MRPTTKAILGSIMLFAGLAPVCWGAVPILNSDYRAPHVLYLDFTGYDQYKTEFTCPWGSPEGWPVDWSTTDISGALAADDVRRIWEAVAEDYAPFNVNVTTDARYAPARGQASAVRIAIGVASIAGLGHSPALCESDSLANPPYLNSHIDNASAVNLDPTRSFIHAEVAKRISHEAGHLYGLNHHTAAAGLQGDWIMAPQRNASRYIWRDGINEFGRSQNDVAHLAALLGRRPDEPQPSPLKSTGMSLINNPPILYARATLAAAGDSDDFLFTPTKTGTLEFRVWQGIWTNIWSPSNGEEPNARYRFSIVSQDGRSTLACPESNVLTMSVSNQASLGLDCLTRPPGLKVWNTYRIRVYRSATTYQPGNLGRYTITVKDADPAFEPPELEPRPIWIYR